MTQENKDLLFKDLCARLPYGVKIDNMDEPSMLISINKKYRIIVEIVEVDKNPSFNSTGLNVLEIEDAKPYLFPLSSMTDELWNKEFRGCGITEFTRDSFKYGCETLEFNNSNPDLSSMIRFINQLIKNHFDIYGLIPMGLALDATGLNIY